MTNTTMVDRVVENKFLLITQRIVIFLVPFFIAGAIAYFNAQSAATETLTKAVNDINTRVTLLEDRGPLLSARQDDKLQALQRQVDQLSTQMVKVSEQNVQMLQSLSRLEAAVGQ